MNLGSELHFTLNLNGSLSRLDFQCSVGSGHCYQGRMSTGSLSKSVAGDWVQWLYGIINIRILQGCCLVVFQYIFSSLFFYQGAQEMFQELPHIYVEPHELKKAVQMEGDCSSLEFSLSAERCSRNYPYSPQMDFSSIPFSGVIMEPTPSPTTPYNFPFPVWWWWWGRGGGGGGGVTVVVGREEGDGNSGARQ